MNRDLRNTSLSVQAAQLKRSLEKRDKRRQQDRVQRANQQDDGFSAEPQHTHAQPAQGHSAVAALNVISAADASLSAPSFSCELCKATFLTHVQHQQHLQSAVHRKALDKQAAEQARERSMASAGLNDMAAMAMGAAAWGATHSAGGGPGPGP
ncbi:C2H2-type domain-containing protein [Haematococcus lacustris]|uniref:C2H2-type domain-containing protein n=2 Tax=Haematococcus lacustris TaxID=44745 RepID=A0A699Z4I3_HAELA|nr:C2H2-type domain-containing protein [Haematococcus lacustris]